MTSAFLQWLYADAADVPQTGYEVSPNSDPMSPKFTRPRDSASGSDVRFSNAGYAPVQDACPADVHRAGPSPASDWAQHGRPACRQTSTYSSAGKATPS